MSHSERIPGGSSESKGVFNLYVAEASASLESRLHTIFEWNSFPSHIKDALEQEARLYPHLQEEIAHRVMDEVKKCAELGTVVTPDEIRERMSEEFTREAYDRIKRYVDTQIAPQVGIDRDVRAFDVDNFMKGVDRLLLNTQ